MMTPLQIAIAVVLSWFFYELWTAPEDPYEKTSSDGILNPTDSAPLETLPVAD